MTQSGSNGSTTPKDVKKYLQQTHDRIFENNRSWAEEQKKKHPEFFENLSAGQSPEYLWIGESSHHAPPLSHLIRPFLPQSLSLPLH